MQQCAFCGSTGPLTKEHLWPECLLEREPSQRGTSTAKITRTRGKVLHDTDVTTKDVCSACNHGPLSDLDAYICGLYDQYFVNSSGAGGRVVFGYDYDLLARWLLKTLYNSSRHNDYDVSELATHTDYVLKGAPRPKRLAIFLRLLAPVIPIEELRKALGLQPNETIPAKGHWIARLVTPSPLFEKGHFVSFFINAYCFYVFLAPQQVSDKGWAALLRAFARKVPDAMRIHPTYRRVEVRTSKVNWVEGNPAYQDERERRLQREYLEAHAITPYQQKVLQYLKTQEAGA